METKKSNRDNMSDLKSILIESFKAGMNERKGDVETRKDAGVITKYIIDAIESNKVKPSVSSDGTKLSYSIDLEPVSSKYLSTLNLTLIKDLKANYVARFLPDTKVLLIPVKSLKVKVADVLKSRYQDLYHEIIHYIDSEKYDVRKAYDTGDYVNTHPELNAYFHEISNFFERNKNLISKDPTEFIRTFWDKLKEVHSGDIQTLSDDNKRRLTKRIYQFHQSMI